MTYIGVVLRKNPRSLLQNEIVEEMNLYRRHEKKFHVC